jgi:hypothetical protein
MIIPKNRFPLFGIMLARVSLFRERRIVEVID